MPKNREQKLLLCSSSKTFAQKGLKSLSWNWVICSTLFCVPCETKKTSTQLTQCGNQKWEVQNLFLHFFDVIMILNHCDIRLFLWIIRLIIAQLLRNTTKSKEQKAVLFSYQSSPLLFMHLFSLSVYSVHKINENAANHYIFHKTLT